MNNVVDLEQRKRAIDARHSFCVSAPAGSGKTELLIQRYLRLLSRVSRPEQVLAITFTRKAAAEMRERVLDALDSAVQGRPCDSEHQQLTRELALETLAANDRGEWHLLRDISRLNIKTIDGFCLSLTRQMPVLSGFGGQANPRDDASALYEEAVVELFALLDSDHEVAADLKALLSHFDNNWARLQELLVSMLRRRDQWRMYVGVHESPQESEQYLVAVVESLVCEALEELSSTLAPYSEELLELMRFWAANLAEGVPAAFPTPVAGDLSVWRQLRKMLQTDKGNWRERITKTEGFPADKEDEARARKAGIKRVIAELAEIPELESRLSALNLLPEISPGSESWRLVLHLSHLLPVLAAQLLLVFRREGVVDYSQVSELALQALGTDDNPTELALRLDYRIEHLLVDEFQDTSINQFELLEKLTRGWGEYNAANPDAPRTLMVVGDAMQSIYGFRDANVGLFLKAREEGFNGVQLEHLQLQCNFRSQEGIVSWVNGTFQAAFPPEDDILGSQVKYSPATAVKEAGAEAAVCVDAFRGENSAAAEVEFVCEHIARCVERGESSIAVLGRQRNHLRPISRRLQEMGVEYHAQDLDSLAHSPAVADLLTLCRALSGDADRLSWLALLRAPWCGLTLSDLLCISRFGQGSPYLPVRRVLDSEALSAQLSADGNARVLHVRQALQWAMHSRDRLGLRVWVEQVWLALGGPQSAADKLALQDAESFFQMLEQAESEGRGLDVPWLAQQVEKQFMSGGNPACPVHLLTLHKAKGLEFDRVFIPRLNGKSPSDSGDLMLWDEHNTTSRGRVFLLAANDRCATGEPTLYNYLKQQRKNKTRFEATRVLYVGATRAVKNLHLSASVGWDEKKDCVRDAPANSLLHNIWPIFKAQMTVHEADLHNDASSTGERRLVRLRESSLPQAVAAAAGKIREGDNFPERADNHFERSVGTVVHLALEELSLCEELPAAAGSREQQRWRAALRQEGLWGEALDSAFAEVMSAVDTTLQDGSTGRWLLSTQHAQARSEWELTVSTEEGTARNLVIDRTFLDRDGGVRWIVDYKTSQPTQGETLDCFTARECQHYREQLTIYRDAVRHLTAEPIRCALYFTALDLLQPLEDLDLPAKEQSTDVCT